MYRPAGPGRGGRVARAYYVALGRQSSSQPSSQPSRSRSRSHDGAGQGRHVLVLRQGRRESALSDGARAAAGAAAVRARWAWPAALRAESLARAFLPEDHRRSVAPEYIGYTQWQAVHNVFGAASGVLATQALLYAMGLGAGALPLSAAVNWVVKDGFGQLGGVLYATLVAQRFDSDPKHQRFWSAAWLQAATWLEMLAPLAPHLFLLIGSVANVGKNIAWLAMSATKASLNRSFCLRENLGDLTAKCGSQATAAGLAGTALGIGVGAAMGTSMDMLLAAFVPLSAASLWGNYMSLLYAATPTLNVERAHRMLHAAISVRDDGALHLDLARLETPRQVSAAERFMRRVHHVAPSDGCPGIAVSPRLDRLCRSADAKAAVRAAFCPPGGAWGERYYIGALPPRTAGGPTQLGLWFDTRATGADMLLGLYHALACRRLLGAACCDSASAHALSHRFARQTFDSLCAAIAAAGWDADVVYFARPSALVEVERQGYV
ncbi:hypothetical protein H4R18_000192 [Coemansia javaensis]|uniref:Protein root UVB sensitive/RUS domain-containing protein n=1 Tax=Coemansia javaensis TaxID=2761396 RepID=A0A9W8HJ15_9FUNG|nr:hypothetical protein H4R18_000192 [Coemansia javaensis]